MFEGSDSAVGIKGRVGSTVDGQYESHVFNTYWLWEQYERFAAADIRPTKRKGWIDACTSKCTE